jgi:hypothetical protein
MPTSVLPETLTFPNGNQAKMVNARKGGAVKPIIAALKLPAPRGVVVVNGGTSELDATLAARLSVALQDGVARVAAEKQLTVVTGATDAGIFHLLGEGLARWGHTAPCIGVTVASLVRLPQGSAPQEERSDLEPHHSHFVLTTGEHWGDETATMYALIAALSAKVPSVAIFAGGGGITRAEALANARQKRPSIVLAGSGRFADELSAVVRGEATPAKDDVSEIVQAGNISLFDLRQPPEQLAALVKQQLHLS